jgi:hypothetical protein
MAKMKASVLVSEVVNIANNYKTLYVMGCFGAPLNSSTVARYCTNHEYNRRSERTAMIRAAANKTPCVFGFDCVNLIKAVLWGWDGNTSKSYGGAVYASNGVPDINADGMIAKCSGVSTTGWDKMVPGEAVWCTGHIGVYIGNGLAVECTPSWKNCVQITAVGNIGARSGYPTRNWTKHGKMPYVDYDTNVASQPVVDKTDYSALIKKAVAEGDYVAAAKYEQKRNEKIDALNALGQNPNGYKKTFDYQKYLTSSANAPSASVKIASPKSKDNSAKYGVRFKVTASMLNVRSSASSADKKNILKTVPKNTVLTWYGYYTGSFYYVQFSDKSIGYVHKSYLQKI